MGKFDCNVMLGNEKEKNVSQEDMDGYKLFLSSIGCLTDLGWKPKSKPMIVLKQGNPWMPEEIDYCVHVDLDLNMEHGKTTSVDERSGFFDERSGFFMEPKWTMRVDLGDLLATESMKESVGYKESEKDRWKIECTSDDARLAVEKIQKKVQEFMTEGTLGKLVSLQQERQRLDDEFGKIIRISE